MPNSLGAFGWYVISLSTVVTIVGFFWMVRRQFGGDYTRLIEGERDACERELIKTKEQLVQAEKLAAKLDLELNQQKNENLRLYQALFKQGDKT